MAAMFQLSNGGVGVMADLADNPANHQAPHHDAGTRIGFEVVNVGDTAGAARVGVEVDDVALTEWSSGHTDPGGSPAGFVSLGRLGEGEHTVLIFVNPGSGAMDHQSNTFGVA